MQSFLRSLCDVCKLAEIEAKTPRQLVHNNLPRVPMRRAKSISVGSGHPTMLVHRTMIESSLRRELSQDMLLYLRWHEIINMLQLLLESKKPSAWTRQENYKCIPLYCNVRTTHIFCEWQSVSGYSTRKSTSFAADYHTDTDTAPLGRLVLDANKH